MSEHFINLNCANCGAKLDVYDDMERFACGYCGTEMVVQRRGGTVALKAVAEAIQKVQIGTDKTAAELALIRLRQELAALESKEAALKPEHKPLPSGCAATSAIVGCGVGILLIIAFSAPLIGLMIMILGGGVAAAAAPEKYQTWKTAKTAIDAEKARVNQDIAQQMDIVSPSSGGSTDNRDHGTPTVAK